MSGADYKLLSYARGRQARAGLLVGGWVHDLQAVLRDELAYSGEVDVDATSTGLDSVLGVLQRWTALRPLIERAAARMASGERRAGADAAPQALASVQLLAPILYPGGLYCVGANYRDHTREMARVSGRPEPKDPRTTGARPWHFIKTTASSIIGPGASFRLPAYSNMVDWELEIGVVIGKACKNVVVEHAMDHVAGFTILNDLSARDQMKRVGAPPESPMLFDWLSHKCFDDSCPMGPWIVPTEQIANPADMAMKLWVNDELMQDSNSSEMIFDIKEQIAHLSTRFTLQPGDVLATGTPAGVGMARGRFLQPGDTVRMAVDGIGEMTNVAVAEGARGRDA